MEFKKTHSIFLQIAEMISEQILLDQLPSKSKIASVREMAANLQVNPNTIMRTYTHLQDKGIITNKRGIGFFVAADAKSIITQQEKEAFIQNELPLLLRKMVLLDIDFDRVKHLYEESKTKIESKS